mmetsp:Transcript_74851/g.148310  ORF Transcript_74851/g.148310 Transcript_74851/m.148310 type:complete len:693 (-) Transcript_74851:63-2141(-)
MLHDADDAMADPDYQDSPEEHAEFDQFVDPNDALPDAFYGSDYDSDPYPDVDGQRSPVRSLFDREPLPSEFREAIDKAAGVDEHDQDVELSAPEHREENDGIPSSSPTRSPARSDASSESSGQWRRRRSPSREQGLEHSGKGSLIMPKSGGKPGPVLTMCRTLAFGQQKPVRVPRHVPPRTRCMPPVKPVQFGQQLALAPPWVPRKPGSTALAIPGQVRPHQSASAASSIVPQSARPPVNRSCPEGFRAIGNWFLKSKVAQAERELLQQPGKGADPGKNSDRRPPLQNPRQPNPRSLLEAVPRLAVGFAGKGGAAGGLASLLASVRPSGPTMGAAEKQSAVRPSGSTMGTAEKQSSVRTLLPIKVHKDANASSAGGPGRRVGSFWKSSLGRAAATAAVKRPTAGNGQGIASDDDPVGVFASSGSKRRGSGHGIWRRSKSRHRGHRAGAISASGEQGPSSKRPVEPTGDAPRDTATHRVSGRRREQLKQPADTHGNRPSVNPALPSATGMLIHGHRQGTTTATSTTIHSGNVGTDHVNKLWAPPVMGASNSKSGGAGRRGIASRRVGRSPQRRSGAAKSRSSSGCRARTRRRIGSASSGRRARSSIHGNDKQKAKEASQGQRGSAKTRKRPRSRSSSYSSPQPRTRRGGQAVRHARSPARKTTRVTRARSSSSDTGASFDSELRRRIQRVLEK